MTAIVRVAIIVVTIALFLGSAMNALSGQRDLAVLFALAAPLGISAWGFARGGHNEEALVLLCGVLAIVVTLVLILNPRGAQDVAVTAYGGIVLTGALLLSRRAFLGLVALIVTAASTAFLIDIYGLSSVRVGTHTTWAQFAEFLVIMTVFATLGRFSSEALMGSVGDANRASMTDPVTGLYNRHGFNFHTAQRIRSHKAAIGTLVLADLDEFRRVNVVIGHGAGDAVLREFARRLLVAAEGHVLARIGDDEFAIFVIGFASEAECEPFARKLHEALQFEFSGVSVRSSMGYARYPRDSSSVESLLLAAGSALAQAKDHATEPAHFAGPADRI
jgi:diguanylate cyclase (GGDEF)-like protein